MQELPSYQLDLFKALSYNSARNGYNMYKSPSFAVRSIVSGNGDRNKGDKIIADGTTMGVS